MSLNAYNSQYPLAYYEIGTAYSFYQHSFLEWEAPEATGEQITNYSLSLQTAKNKNYFVPENGKCEAINYIRTIGVVVGKNKGGSIDTIEVMFEEDGRYVIRKYVAEGGPSFFDDNERVQVKERKGTGPIVTKSTGPATDDITGPTTSADGVTGPTVEKVTDPTKRTSN